IQGKRVGLGYDRKGRRFYEDAPEEEFPVTLVVHTGISGLAHEELSSLIDKMFVSRLDPVHDLPKYWQKFFSDPNTADTLAPWVSIAAPATSQPVLGIPMSPTLNSAFRPGVGGVTAPRLIYNTDPKYEEFARHAKYQGTSVV